MKIIKTSEALPKSGRYVLAWLEGAKIPMRAMWAAQHTLPLGDDADPEWGEYSEEKDEYFCPAGWYEMNQFEEQHWGVSGNVVAWCELPRLDHQCLAQIEEPAQPVLYVSPGQLANHSNPEGPESEKAGRYLPARKTPAGKFIQPLYAGAAPADGAPRARDLLGIVRTAQSEARRLINGEDSGSDLAQTKLDLPETLRVLEHALSRPAAVAGSAVGVKFFSASNEGLDEHDTAEAAQNEAQSIIDMYREEAADGWPEEVDSVCWGVILGKAVERPVKDAPFMAGILGSDMEPVDYVLEPVAAPALEAPPAVAPQGEYPHEQMDAMALARYKVVPSHASMLWSHAVVAGDGAQQLYVGREVECQNMARKFAGAFLDGAFAFHSMAAAPTAQAAPALEAPAAPAGDEEAAFTKWFQGERGKPYQGMWEFARAAWMARAATAASHQAQAHEAPATTAVEALRALMSLVRRDAPHLSGKVMGEADAILASAALAAALQTPAAPGMAVTALVGEIVAALEADEKDGGHDLTAGLFGPKFSSLVRRWAASEWAHIAAPQAPAAPSAVEGVAQFRKRPVTISAIQWTGKNLREVITFTDGPPETRGTHAGMDWEAYTDLVERDGLMIYTLEGKMHASVGDWIIRGVKGEHYPCKPDIFAETYEPVAAAPAAPAVDASGAVPVVLGKKLFQFSCHQDWVNRAQRAWKMASVRSEDTICLDQKGRVLRKGLEFARADKEGAFPVVVYLALVDDTAAHDAWLAAQAAAKGEHDE